MSTYVVMAPPEFQDLAGDPREGDRLLFVPDRFSVLAFAFSFIWMLVHRMWLVLLGSGEGTDWSGLVGADDLDLVVEEGFRVAV